MSKKRTKKTEIEETVKNEEQNSKIQTVKKVKTKKNMITFEAYFQMLMKDHTRVLAHHKLPMKKFATKNGIIEKATKEEFEELFKKY